MKKQAVVWIVEALYEAGWQAATEFKPSFSRAWALAVLRDAKDRYSGMKFRVKKYTRLSE